MKHRAQGKTIYFAILLICVGMVFLADQMDWLSWQARNILISWPMLLVAIGFINLIQRQSRIFGVIMILVGGLFLLPKFGVDIDIGNIWRYWPVLLIVFGLSMIFKFAFRRSSDPADSTIKDSDGDLIDEVNIFGGGERPIVSQNFKGGTMTCVFGGSELDLTQAKLSPGKNKIEVFFMFGGSSFRVPPGWTVNLSVTSIFGGFSDKRRLAGGESQDPSNVLEISGMAIFGGGEIKN